MKKVFKKAGVPSIGERNRRLTILLFEAIGLLLLRHHGLFAMANFAVAEELIDFLNAAPTAFHAVRKFLTSLSRTSLPWIESS